MRIHHLIQVTLSLLLINGAFGADFQVGTLSEGACWYEAQAGLKDGLKIVSFNDKSLYSGSREEIVSGIQSLMSETQHLKITDMNFGLHCGGYGASLVVKVTTENMSYCVWAKFDKGKLGLRSIGAMAHASVSQSTMCSGHKWGEFIMGVTSEEVVDELRTAKWASVIKEINRISVNVYKVVLIKDYEFKEAEAANLLEESFTGKNSIRYIEFNDYRHPIGEFYNLK